MSLQFIVLQCRNHNNKIKQECTSFRKYECSYCASKMISLTRKTNGKGTIKHSLSTDFSLCLCALLYQVLGLQAAERASVGRSAASDERTALDQALLLVEILKSEYAKLVSEKKKLQENKVINEPTCATTTENRLLVTFTISENQDSKLIDESPDKVGTTQAPATPFSPWNYRHSNSFHRRRWLPPAAYYYDGELNDKRKWRRFQYDDIVAPRSGINGTRRIASEGPAALNATAAPTTTITTASKPPSSITTVTTTKSAANTVRVIKTSSPPIFHTTTNKITTYPSSSPTEITEQIYSKKVSIATSSKLGREPELSQASEEFAKELVDAVPRSGRQRRLSVLWRGTTKLYLADSTRYPLPLPENHAFCFTNPHSALCKTLV